MITRADIMLGGILPGLLAVAALIGVWKCTANAASSWRTAVVLSFIVGMWALDAQGVGITSAISKSVRIQEARDFLPLAAILAIVPDAVATMGKRGVWVGWLFRIGLCGLLPWRLLVGSAYLPRGNSFGNDAWTTSEAVGWLTIIAVVLVGVWQFWRTGRNDAPRIRSLLGALVACAAAATLALSGSLTYGQIVGVLTAALVGCGVASAFLKLDRGPDAAAGPLVIIFGGMIVLAHFFAELKLSYAAALIVAYALAGGRFFPKWRYANVVRGVCCIAVVGAVVTMAAMDFAAAQAEAADNPYLNYQP